MIYGIERTAKLVRSFVMANIDSYLTTIESEFTAGVAAVGLDADPIALPRPATDQWFLAAKDQRMRAYPSVVVRGRRARLGYQTAEMQYYTEDEGGGGHDLSVIWVDCDDDPERLVKKLWRSNLAIVRMLAGDQGRDLKVGGQGMVMFVKVSRHGEVSPLLGTNPFVQAVRLDLVAQLEESIG